MSIYRLMGIDYGEVRIGIALSDPMRIISKPYKVLKNEEGTIWKQMKEIIATMDVGKIILGLPVNYSGEDTAKTKEIRAFYTKLKKHLQIEVEFWDERYSTLDSKDLLKKMGYTPQDGRKVIDKVAASLILKSYMENN